MKNNKKQAFDKISRELTRNNQLTDSGYRLMVMILNNTKDWKINLTYYSNLLNWSAGKLSRVTKHLIELGYITKKKKSLGRGKGFAYDYTIVEQVNTTSKQVKQESNINIPTEKVIAREEVISIEEPKVTTKIKPLIQTKEQIQEINSIIEKKTCNEFNSFLDDNIPTEKDNIKQVSQFSSEEVIIGEQQHKKGGSRLKDFLNSIDINNMEDNRTQVVK